jgi:hypothetical protein
MKTGEVKKIATYQWSSYQEYLGEHRLVDPDFALNIFSSEPEIAVRRFERFMKEEAEDISIMVHGNYKLTDQKFEGLETIEILCILVGRDVTVCPVCKKGKLRTSYSLPKRASP